MREINSSPRATRRRLGLLAVPTAMALGLTLGPVVDAQAQLSSQFGSSSSGWGGDDFTPSAPPERTPVETTYPEVAGLPEGVEVERVEWLSPRHIALFIKSQAMPGELIQVQMLLARDWHSNPDRTFPEVWALDGLRARDDENGWTIETNIIAQYADKNVNVILPVGGQSSFYSDWQRPNNGKHYMWESFLTRELVPILDNGFRSNRKRAVVGLSMGGTAAMNLAERHPYLFDFVGSFSGYLDTTTPGMPEAITAAMLDAGGYDATAMWGPRYSQDWIDHDPKLGLDALKDMTVYVSAGSGRDDFGLVNSVARNPANAAGVGLEILSRMTTQTFVDYAKGAGVGLEVRFRPSGVHSWEYWQFELSEAWPYIADALELSEADRGANCTPVGAIAIATQSGIIGSCVNNEYDVAGGAGKAEDFRGGTAYWSPSTGAKALYGDINAHYVSLGGPGGWLGFPLTGEEPTPDGVGRFVHFQYGSIYWTPSTGAHAIPGDLFQFWGTQGYERSHVGYPVELPKEIRNGLVQEFQNGYITRNPNGVDHHLVHGAISVKYGEMGTAESPLGYPTSEEIAIPGGAFQQFEHGNIYWSPETGAHVIYYGDIFNRWGTYDYERGPFGYPTTDMEKLPEGGLRIEFSGGSMEQKNGVIEERRR